MVNKSDIPMDAITHIKYGEKSFGIHDLSPLRKKPCLCIYDADDNCYIKVASFNDSQAGIMFMEYIADIFKDIENNKTKVKK